MKNIETILTEAGLTLTPEQTQAITKEVNANYKTISEVEKKDAKINALTEKVTATEEALKAFEGVDAEGMKSTIENLQKSLKDKDAEYAKALSDRDFNDILKESISKAGGINAKAITALLDTDTLKASKNQREDVASAIKALAEADDSKMLFNIDPPKGGSNPIGAVGKGKVNTTSRDEKYKDNPYYHPKTE